jgi:hypothetical protein
MNILRIISGYLDPSVTCSPSQTMSIYKCSPEIYSGMQCPDCGYEVDDTAVFCPRCRFPFRETSDTPVVPGTSIPDTPVHDAESGESLIEKTQQAFSDKELRMLEVQLLQPAILVVLVISLVMYTVISTVPFIPVTVAGLSFGVTGIICLALGLVAGMLFFILSRRSLEKLRYR